MYKFLYWLISSNFLFLCHILGLKFFYTLFFQKCSIVFSLSLFVSVRVSDAHVNLYVTFIRGKVVPVCTIKVYGGEEIKFHLFLSLVIGGGESTASCSSCLMPRRESSIQSECEVGWDPELVWTLLCRKQSCLCCESVRDSSVIQPIA